MRDLSEAGRSVVDAPASPPTPVEQIAARARGRRRRGRALTAVVTGLALVIGAAALAQTLRSSPADAPPAAHRGTTTPPATDALDAVRLRAHDGVGVPDDWKPVDYGDARVWVPESWTVTAGGCPGRGPGWVQLGGPYKISCPVHEVIATIVDITGRATATGGLPARDVNGYRVYQDAHEWIVPELGAVITARGPDAARVVASLAPSARSVALDFPAEPVPADWHRVSFAGVSLAVPNEWPVSRAQCSPIDAGRMYVDVDASADCPPARTPTTPVDGAAIDTWPFSDTPTFAVNGEWAPRVLVRAHEADTRFPSSILELLVVAGDDEHSVSIGLGRDGRVANRILHSLQAASGTTLTVPGCAPTSPPVPKILLPRLHEPIVPDLPEDALLCAYPTSPDAAGFALRGAQELEATPTARALNASSTNPETFCKLAAGAPVATLEFAYADGKVVALMVDACRTTSSKGHVPTPPLLWETVQRLAR